MYDVSSLSHRWIVLTPATISFDIDHSPPFDCLRWISKTLLSISTFQCDVASRLQEHRHFHIFLYNRSFPNQVAVPLNIGCWAV